MKTSIIRYSHQSSFACRSIWRGTFAAICALMFLFMNQSAKAQVWATTDALVLSGSATGVACDSAGTIFVSGQVVVAPGIYQAAILKSTNRGDSFEPAFVSENPALLSFSSVTVAKVRAEDGSLKEQIVAVGWSKVPRGSSWIRGWEVFRSVDAGEHWEALTPQPYEFPYTSQNPEGVAADEAGNIYVVGNAREDVVATTKKNTTTTTYGHWITLKGTRIVEGGGERFEWAPAEDLRGNINVGAFAITCVGNEVFAVGSLDNFWEVRKCAASSTSWLWIDRFQLELGQFGRAVGITADADGSLVVTGTAIRSGSRRNTTENCWVTRRGSSTGGFQPINVFPGGNGWGVGVSIDQSGSVHTIGAPAGPTGSWVARQGVLQPNNSWLWATTDQYGTYASYVAQAIASDPAGNVYVVGYSQLNGASQWVMRRRLMPAP